MADLSIIILTFNEERHVERAVLSALQVAGKVFVVDSLSTDGTRALAESAGAEVSTHPFTTHAAQLQWAVDTLPLDSDWVMRLDADEIITSALAADIRARLSASSADVTGLLVSRCATFAGTLIRHGLYPQWQLRLWRRGAVGIEQRWMDEHVFVRSGRVERLAGDLVDDNLNGISWWIAKHNNYSSREAVDLLNRKHAFLPAAATTAALSGPIARRRWLKENVYLRAPAGLRAFLLFGYRMVFRLGILDGPRGFAFHFLQGLWYRYLVDLKVRDVERRMKEERIDCPEAIRRELGIDPRA